MARPREFDTEEALRRATEVFWERGYEAASVEELCAAMDLSRSSLYHAFGSKHDLLHEVLDRYAASAAERIARQLAAERPIQAAVERFLDGFIEDVVSGTGRRGCLIGNCAAELAAGDAGVAEQVGRSLERIEEVFHAALLAARDRGELAPEADPRALAHYLTASVQGLRLVAKAKPDRRSLADIKRYVLSALQ